MGARALGVGALFVNVLLVLAPDGSRSPFTPVHRIFIAAMFKMAKI